MNKLWYRLQLVSASFIGNLAGNKMEAYWYIKDRNAGDLVTPLLLRHYGFTPVHSYPGEARVFACGSLLEKVPEGFSGYILGTGFMHGDSVRSFKNAKILAVRGELTRKNLGAPASTVLGDPGLLAARLLPKREKKRHALGIVPHYVDKADTCLRALCAKYPKEVLFIDIQENLRSVLRKIDQCETILSSSLHGLVFADALGIPNLWVILSSGVSGKGFKFHDYNSALQKVQKPVDFTGGERLSDLLGRACEPSGEAVMKTISNLDGAFRTFRSEARQTV